MGVTFKVHATYNPRNYEPCNKCNTTIALPWLCMQVFVPTRLEEGEKGCEGFVLLGGVSIPLDPRSESYETCKYELRNYHLMLEEDGAQERLGCVILQPRQSTVKVRLPDDVVPSPRTLDKWRNMETRYQGEVCLESDVSVERTVFIGAHAGVIPRAMFYYRLRERVRCTWQWADAMLKFAFFLRRVTIQEVNMHAGPKPDWWERALSAIVFAFTLFVTRMRYQRDWLTYSGANGGQKDFEYFNQVATPMFGTGDCEDFAFQVKGMLDFVKTLPDPQTEELRFAQKMLVHYHTSNLLVHATAPKIEVSRGGVVDDSLTQVPADAATALRELGCWRNYHMTCILMPSAYVRRMLVNGGRNLECGVCFRDLEEQVAEATASIHSINQERLVDDDSKVLTLQKWVAEKRDCVCGLTGKNFNGAAWMIGPVLEFCDENMVEDGEGCTLWEVHTKLPGGVVNEGRVGVPDDV